MADAHTQQRHSGFSEPFAVEGGEVRVGASIGIAHFPAGATDMPALMRGADAAMYHAKRRGGGVRAS